MRPAFLFSAFWVLSGLALASGMVVGPARIEAHLAAGESQTTTITVTNPENASRRFRLRVQPFTLTETGDLSLEPAASGDSGVLDWIQINPEEVEIAAEQAAPVRVQVTVPAGAKGTLWAGILVSIPPTGRATKGFGVTTEPRVLVPVYVTVKGTERTEVEIVNFRAVRDRNGVFHFRAGLHNTGNNLIRPAGSWLLEENTPSGPVELLVVPFSGEPVLPGQLRKFEGEARGKVPSQNLTASVFFDYGPNRADMASQSVPVSSAESGPARETRELASGAMTGASAHSRETSAARPVRISYRKEGILLEAGETIRYRSELKDSPPALFLDLVGYRVVGPRFSGGASLVEALKVDEIQARPVVTRLEVRFKVPVEAKVIEQPTGLLIAITSKTPSTPESAETVVSPSSKPARGYAVQAGAFAESDNAQALKSRLTAAGFTVIEESARRDGRPLILVLVGPYTDRDSAEKARERLQTLGIPDGSLRRLGPDAGKL